MQPEQIASGLTHGMRWCVLRGGGRYGTRIGHWKDCRDAGLAEAYDKGAHKKVGRWTWRLTSLGRSVQAVLKRENDDAR